MGCYGLGVSRILAACLEVMSTETEVRWPRIIAPYQVCIVPPKVSKLTWALWMFGPIVIYTLQKLRLGGLALFLHIKSALYPL